MTEVGRATVVIDADDSRLKASLAKAQQETVAGVAGIEQGIRGQLGAGISGSLSGGNWKSVGKNLGNDIVQGITAPFGAIGNVAGGVATALGPVGIAAVAGTAAVGALGVASSRAAMQWEAGMSQISKTTGIEKGSEAFKQLDSDLINLYSTMPTTVAEIQSVAAAAGSLGIEKSSIAGFTEVALQMGSAFDVPAEEAATAIGKIKGQLKSLPEGAKDSTDFARQFGSAVDYVGNNFNATERDVLDFSTRVAGSMSALGGGAYEVAGWGGMLSSVFPSAERAAGSFDALLTQLTTNEDAQAKAAELLGMSTDEFMQAMSTDPSDTLLRIGSALEALPADQLLSTAKTLGGAYGMDTLTKMVGHTDEWRKSIEDTVEAGKKGESIGDSFEASANNMKAQLQILGNSVGAIFKDIGGPINNALTPVISSVAGSLNSIRQIGENLWEPMVAGLSPLTSGISAVTGAVAQLGGMGLNNLVEGSKQVNTAFQTGKAYVTAFVEELQSLANSNSTIQAVISSFDQFKNKLGEIGEFWTDILGKIVDGLSSAIPTAVSGAAGAVGSLFSQGLNAVGLGGVAEGAGSLFGDVSGFFGRVADRAKEKLGMATEEAVADGTKDGMEKGAQDAKPGVAGAVADAVDGAFWSGAMSRQRAGVSQSYAYGAETSIATSMHWETDAKGNRRFVGVPLPSGSGKNKWESAGWEVGGVQEGRISYSMRYVPSKNGGTYTLTRTTPDGKTTDVGKYNIHYDAAGLPTPANEALQDIINRSDTTLSPGNFAALSRQPYIENIPLVIRGAFANVAGAIDSEIKSTGNLINESLKDNWFDPDALQAAAGRLQDLKLFDPEEFARQGGNNALAYVGAIQDKLESLEAARVRLEADPDDEQARAEVQKLIGDLQTFAKENPLVVTIDGDNRPLIAKVMEAYYKGEDLAKLGISDLARFKKSNEAAELAQLKEYLNQGLAPTGESDLYKYLYEEYKASIDNWARLTESDRQRTLDLGEALHSGGTEWMDFGNKSGIALDQLEQKAKAASVGFDNVTDSCKECNEAMSEFGQWQESNADKLFEGSYIGQGGQSYLDWKMNQIQDIAATQRAMASVGGAVLGKDYTNLKLDLDTSQAEGTWHEFQAQITEEQKMPLTMDDSQAMSAIAGIEQRASQPVVKPVYVQEIGSSSPYRAPGVAPMSAQDTWYNWLPSYGAGDVFVPEPTLAIVGDRPGGEWIGGLDQAQARFGGAGQITISPTYQFNAPIYGVDDLQAVLEENNRRLVQQVAEASKGL